MYKNRKFNRNLKKQENGDNAKRTLKTIDENASIKIPRLDDKITNIGESHRKDEDPGALDEMFSSEENIPASQEPTQRYLSQRSTIAATLRKTQSNNSTCRAPNTYFELVLMKAGVSLDEPESFILSCHHISFVSKFREIIQKSQNFPENIDIFTSGLRDGLNPKSKMALKLLSGCTISPVGEECIYQSQDSMIVNFLMIDFLRDHVVNILLDKIDELCSEQTQNLKVDSTIPLLPLMLTQLRYVKTTHADLIFNKIRDIYEKSSVSAKWDIISTSDNTLDVSKHDDFVQLICDTIENGAELFKSVYIEAFINLSLSNKMQGQLRYKILNFIKETQCSIANLPLLVKLLLKALGDENENNLKELLNTLREILIWYTTAGTKSSSEKQIILEIFTFIEQGLTHSKRFYSVWQKYIASLPANQFRFVDLIILVLLIHVKDDNSLYIENILRRRIKQEHITSNILVDGKNKYSPIIERYSYILMQMLHDFLKEKTKLVTDFAKSSYGVLFQICEATQKDILKKLLELTCERTANNMTNRALCLIKELQLKYPKEVQNWGAMLMPLLDRLNELSLSQTRLVMEILCSIAFPPPNLEECPLLQDQIDMVVKKQLINKVPFIKKQGIIGSVQLIDNIARIEKNVIEHDDFNTTFNTVSDLPDGRGKVAANYIVRIQSSTMYCPESLALFYDELASVCASLPTERANCGFNYDKPFLIWLCEVMTYYFQNSFVAEHSPESIRGIDLDYLQCINSAEDTTNTEEQQVLSIGINIAELVLKPKNEASSSILVLAPLFNLVRVLCLQRYEGSLETINALLGCAIVLPTFFDKSIEEDVFNDLDLQQQKEILDIYFHCVNWIRVTVTSFASQREDMTRVKVLQRLGDLIKMEKKIKQFLKRGPPDYMPPMSQFLSNVQPKTASGRLKSSSSEQNKKAAHSKAKISETTFMNINTMDETKGNQTDIGDLTKKIASTKNTKDNRTNFEKLYGPKEIYRQMDSNIMLILHEKFSIDFPLPLEEVGKQFGLLEFRFILTDLVSKLESINGIEKNTTEQSLQHIAKPQYFINDLSNFLKIIVQNKIKIGEKINFELEKAERVYGNGDLFTTEFSYLKVCYGLCIRLLSLYFSWSGFHDSDGVNVLKESLLSLLSKKDIAKMKGKSVPLIAAEAFKICYQFEPFIVELKTVINLHQLLLNLRRFSYIPQDTRVFDKQAKDIRTFCRTLLCRKWFNYEGVLEKGAQTNIYLDELIKGFLRNSDFRRQNEILNIISEECKFLNNKDSSLKSFPNFKKGNFPLLFRGLCEILITSVHDAISVSSESGNDKMQIWESSCNLLNMLLDIVQSLDIPRNFVLFLKYSHLYLKLVLQNGLQIFEQHLRKNPERVSAFLKNLQLTTRFLHNLCCHSKALKNITIINQIPFLRETVENLVFRVKALLTANKCASVFWMGNLLNKDLHGDQILSQKSATLSLAEEENSDEEIPEDDVSVDETLFGENNTSSCTKPSSNEEITRDTSSSTTSRSKCF